jgi:hypothetical protein
MLPHPTAARGLGPLLLALVLFVATACNGDDFVPVEGVIDRETFIAAYVDLRAQTLLSSEVSLPNEERDQILARHGVDPQDLEAFAAAYGGELDFMNGVWSEIDSRLEARSPSEPKPAVGDSS